MRKKVRLVVDDERHTEVNPQAVVRHVFQVVNLENMTLCRAYRFCRHDICHGNMIFVVTGISVHNSITLS